MAMEHEYWLERSDIYALGALDGADSSAKRLLSPISARRSGAELFLGKHRSARRLG